MEKHVEDYIHYCRTMKLSDKTIENYQRGIEFFCTFLQSEGKGIDMAQPGDILNYLGANPSWSTPTIQIRLAALRSYYRWAQIYHLLPGDNPMLQVRAPKTKKKRNKTTVDREEVYLLTETRRTHRDGTAFRTDLRDRTLIMLLADTSLRVAEAHSLNCRHVLEMDPERRELITVGKGGSENVWLVSLEVYDLLKRYLEVERATDPDRPLFVNRDGGRLSIRSMQIIVQKRGEQVLGRRLHPHMLRHYYGNRFYEASGHDIYATKEAMHHSDVSTTEGYLSIVPDRLKDIKDSMSASR